MHTVLLVEDEDDLRDMMRDVLELNGYTVVAVEEGQAALEAFERIPHVCVVLLDLVMPGMNGWDFYEKMRQRPELANIPVVVHSSSPDRAPVGVTRVVQKPVQIARLLSIVREYCPA
ncbi:MAG: response regulator [Minicystis sp.]